MKEEASPELCGIVVHWWDERGAEELAARWPADRRFDLLFVDNSGSLPSSIARARVLQPGRNLGFGGGVNLGLQNTHAPIVLILNPDVRPEPGAVEGLLTGFERNPDAAGLAPRLLGLDGRSQYRWQLRSIPSLASLLWQALLLPACQGLREEPEVATPVQQPAAAALALRRGVLEQLGGFDEQFFPAWFGDVDLARRLRRVGGIIRYWPESEFRHLLGSSIPRLSYTRFLWVYYSNLCQYLEKHHGPSWATLARLLLFPAAIGRALVLPLRAPRRAASRREAVRALAALALGAASAWRHPSGLARSVRPQADAGSLPR